MTVGMVSPLKGGHSGSAGPFADRKSSCLIPTRVSAAATAGSRRDRSRRGGTPAPRTRSAGRLWSTCLRRRTGQKKHAHPHEERLKTAATRPVADRLAVIVIDQQPAETMALALAQSDLRFLPISDTIRLLSWR